MHPFLSCFCLALSLLGQSNAPFLAEIPSLPVADCRMSVQPRDSRWTTMASVSFVRLHTTVIAAGGGHLAFPDVARLSDGSLVLVYRQGAGHVEDSGRIVMQRSGPHGLSWSDPEVLVDEPLVDDRDPSIAVLSNGEILTTYFRYRQVQVEDNRLYLHQVFAVRSDDLGRTFSASTQVSPGGMGVASGLGDEGIQAEASIPVSLDIAKVAGPHIDERGRWVDVEGQPVMVWACSSPAVEIGERLVIPGYGGQSLNLDNLAASPRSVIVFFVSDDSGMSWEEQPISIDAPLDLWLQEPVLLPLDDGRLLMHLRTAAGDSPGGPGPMAQVTSLDGGATWSRWRAFDFIGHAPYLTRLSNGLVLSAFRQVDNEYTREMVSFIYSSDEGDTWSDPVLIEDCGDEECGYPSVVELEGGIVLFVYYAGGGREIKAAAYRVEGREWQQGQQG